MAPGKMVEAAAPATSSSFFNRDFEKTYGFLKPSDFPPIDWASLDDIQALFPAYKRAALERASSKAAASSQGNNVDVLLNLKSPFGDKDLFVNTVLEIESSKRAALYGINGSGKTCLFDAIASGEIPKFPDYINVHHLKEPDHNPAADALSVLDAVLCSHKYRRVLLPIQEQLRALLDAGEPDAARRARLAENLEYVEAQLQSIMSHTAVKRAQAMLRVLGFDEKGELMPVASLSGGLRMRVALAAGFFKEPEVLLLDEPTNHLDLPSVLWLENRLRGYKGSFLLVTHDRRLLENVVTSVMYIQDQKLEYFNCSFAEFERRKKQMDADREKMIDQFMRKNRNVNPSSPIYPRYKSYENWMVARAERKQLMATKFSFPSAPALSGPEGVGQEDVPLFKVEGLRFSYNAAAGLPFIFDTPVDYEITQGSRLGITGPNGAGKSTFVKLLTDKLTPTEGKITTHPDMKIAYFGQYSTKELPLDMSPREFMEKTFPDANPGALMIHLERSSITYSLANTSISNLSYSQRACTIFAKLTFMPSHVLIVDEGSNYLDLDSVDSLIKAINAYKGAVIIITHNRDFLVRCASKFLSIIPGAFLEFPDMKSAERATYSFISALEEGRDIDIKKAITDNRGGGAAHTEEEQEARRKALALQQAKAKAIADAEAAARKKEEEEAAAKEAARLAKVAAQRLDWAVDEMVWVNAKGKWTEAKVTRNVPGIGVTVELPDKSFLMVNANKVKAENPMPNRGGSSSAPRGGAAAAGSSSGAAGKSRGGAGNNKSRGGASRGGAQGGRGGRGRGGAQQASGSRGGRK